MPTAIKWYETGAERGDFYAASNLAWIYSKGPAALRDLQKAVWYSSLAVALDSYGEHKQEADNLRALPLDEKKKTVERLNGELGNDAGAATADVDDTLVVLSRKAWQKRNPRLDLF